MKRIRFFKQHTSESCGIACVLMILDAWRRVKYPTEKQEKKLYALFKCKAFKGTLASSLGECLYRNGLDVTLFYSAECCLENQGSYYPPSLYTRILDENNDILARIHDQVNIVLKKGFSITLDLLRDELDKGKLLILQVVVPGDLEIDGLHTRILHWVVAYGYDEKGFMICDPWPYNQKHKLALSEAELEQYMDTPVGRAVIAVGEKVTV